MAVVAGAGTVEDTPGSLAGTAGSAVEERCCEHSPAMAVVEYSPGVFAPASDCSEGHSLGTDARSAAAAEGRAHIGRSCMAATASYGCGEDP